MVSYDDFLSRVLPEVPGCPEIVALQAIKDTCIEFCERSLIHQVDHDAVTVSEKVSDYDLETPVQQTKVIKIMKLFYMGNELSPVAPDDIRDPTIYSQSIGGYQAQYATPRMYTQKDDKTFSLYPVPERTLANAVTLRIALAPLRSSSMCDDLLYEYWAEPIACGAVARLQMSPMKAYTNPKAANVSQSRYMVGINEARQKSTRGYVRANLSVSLRRI